MTGRVSQWGRFVLCAIATTLVLATPAQATELLVPSPYANIQAAIDAAEDGDVVIVADLLYPGYSGVGFRDIDFAGKAIEVRSASGVPDNCWINCAGSGRAFHFHSGESFDSIVRGFTITGAYGQGGAILCENSGPTIVRCAIVSNTATPGGYEGGGALCLVDSSPTLSNCDLSSNVTLRSLMTLGGHGGAVYCEGVSSPVLVNCTIANNIAQREGGALYARDVSGPVLLHCTVTKNTARDSVGQIYCVSSRPAIVNCQIHDNTDDQTTGYFGGGILCRQGAVATITNCTIADNSVNVAWPGGGLYCEPGLFIITMLVA